MPKGTLSVGGQSWDLLHTGQLPQASCQRHFGTLPGIPKHRLQGSKRRGWREKQQVALEFGLAANLGPRMPQPGLGRAHSLVVQQVATELGFEAGGAGLEGGVTEPVSGRNRGVVTGRPRKPLHPSLSGVKFGTSDLTAPYPDPGAGCSPGLGLCGDEKGRMPHIHYVSVIPSGIGAPCKSST